MLSRWLADIVVVAHLLFVVFVVSGGALVLRWPRMAWLHLPALAWGMAVEYAGWLCPLTTIEQALHRQAGEAGYAGGFVEHYLLPILYPIGLTRQTQWLLGAVVLAFNAVIYALLVRRLRHGRKIDGRRKA